jgi:hypothetical protein
LNSATVFFPKGAFGFQRLNVRRTPADGKASLKIGRSTGQFRGLGKLPNKQFFNLSLKRKFEKCNG